MSLLLSLTCSVLYRLLQYSCPVQCLVFGEQNTPCYNPPTSLYYSCPMQCVAPIGLLTAHHPSLAVTVLASGLLTWLVLKSPALHPPVATGHRLGEHNAQPASSDTELPWDGVHSAAPGPVAAGWWIPVSHTSS